MNMNKEKALAAYADNSCPESYSVRAANVETVKKTGGRGVGFARPPSIGSRSHAAAGILEESVLGGSRFRLGILCEQVGGLKYSPCFFYRVEVLRRES